MERNAGRKNHFSMESFYAGERMKIPTATIDWLLETGTPAVRYNTRLLAGKKNPDRAELLADPFVTESIKLLKGWESGSGGTPIC
jgi:hypothetical protein